MSSSRTLSASFEWFPETPETPKEPPLPRNAATRLSLPEGRFLDKRKIKPYKMQSTRSCSAVVRALVELQFGKENEVFSCLGVVSSWPRRS